MSVNNHWYDLKTGEPRHTIACKSRPGDRATTLADAKKYGWGPSVTTILHGTLRSPGLERYWITQAVHAVCTAPDVPGEGLDAKIERVLETEKQADEESKRARDLGGNIHEAISEHLAGRLYAPQFKPYVDAALEAMKPLGGVVCSEKVLVHPLGFAGRTDAILQGQNISVLDFKTGKKLPTKSAWPEHRLQVSAYAASLGNTGEQRIQTAVLYISTVEPGKVTLFTQLDWVEDWSVFQSVFRCWCYMNSFVPKPL